jgi:hypothetical protein
MFPKSAMNVVPSSTSEKLSQGVVALGDACEPIRHRPAAADALEAVAHRQDARIEAACAARSSLAGAGIARPEVGSGERGRGMLAVLGEREPRRGDASRRLFLRPAAPLASGRGLVRGPLLAGQRDSLGAGGAGARARRHRRGAVRDGSPVLDVALDGVVALREEASVRGAPAVRRRRDADDLTGRHRPRGRGARRRLRRRRGGRR